MTCSLTKKARKMVFSKVFNLFQHKSTSYPGTKTGTCCFWLKSLILLKSTDSNLFVFCEQVLADILCCDSDPVSHLLYLVGAEGDGLYTFQQRLTVD